MVVTLGETMGLLRAKEVGPLEHVSDFALHIGGAESNVAIGIARLDGSSAWMGRVGDDGVGRLVVARAARRAGGGARRARSGRTHRDHAEGDAQRRVSRGCCTTARTAREAISPHPTSIGT